MGTRRLSPEAKILNLYDDLSEDGKRIVYDLLRAKQPKRTAAKKSTAKKRAAQSAAQRSSSQRTGAEQSTQSSATEKDAATDVGDGSE